MSARDEFPSLAVRADRGETNSDIEARLALAEIDHLRAEVAELKKEDWCVWCDGPAHEVPH